MSYKWWILFALGLLCPLLLPLLPSVRSLASYTLLAQIVSILALVITTVAMARVIAYGFNIRNPLYFLAVIPFLLHPVFQPALFESLDTGLNYRWSHGADKLGLRGKTEAEVSHILGRPSRIVKVPENAQPLYTIFEYKHLPFYWIGSTGHIVFKKGRVVYVGPGQDYISRILQ